MYPGGLSTMPMIAWAVTLLPDPDSPRTARVWPSWAVEERPVPARATPSRGRNSTCRFSASSSGAEVSADGAGFGSVMVTSSSASAQLGVEGVAQRVTHHDEGEYGQPHEDRREEHQVGVGEDAGLGRRELQAPGDRGQLDAHPEEGQGGLGGDDEPDEHRGVDDHRRERVGQNVLTHDAQVPGAERAGEI